MMFMKKSFYFALTLIILILYGNACVAEEDLMDYVNSNGTTGEYDINDYTEIINKYIVNFEGFRLRIPNDYTIGNILNVESAKGAAIDLFMFIYDIKCDADRLNTFYDPISNTWLVLLAPPEDSLGTILYLILSTDGNIQAIWGYK